MSLSRQALTKSFLLESMQGIHDFENDDFMLALYGEAATINEDTTAYSATNEVSGSGYTAGGKLLVPAAGYPLLSAGGKALMDFDDAIWNPAAFTAARWGLIYNFSKANRAVAALDLGALYTPTSTFTYAFPLPTDHSAVIRLGA